jgi:GT2 family glycosyltransferase
MSIAIVTPWHNHAADLWPEYQKVLADANADELWIVDNGSTPPLDFGSLRLDANKGFCGGCNAGLAAATADIIVFLNNDVSLTEHGWLERLTDAVEPGVLVGARLRSDSHAQVDGQPMPYLDGWCIAGMRDDLLDLGGFDETLAEPAYFSDNLLCLEARAAGMTLREVRIGLKHAVGVTAKEQPDGRRALEQNRARYVERARELLTLTTNS